MTLRIIGYWRNDQHPEYPDPRDLVDPTWDGEDRDVIAIYLGQGTYLRGFMGLSQCRICGRSNGSGEFTDGTLVWPEGLSHYIEEHSVRMPTVIEQYVMRKVQRLEGTEATADWWVRGAPEPTSVGQLPLDPLERLAWRGNVQLAQDPARRFPGLFIQGDTLHIQVENGQAEELVAWYEELMTAAGRAQLPY